MSVKYSYKEYQKQEKIPFGFPLVIEVPKVECTFGNLYAIIESQCRYSVRGGVGGRGWGEGTEGATGSVRGMVWGDRQQGLCMERVFLPLVMLIL